MSGKINSKAPETSNQTHQDRGDFQHKHLLSLRINNPHQGSKVEIKKLTSGNDTCYIVSCKGHLTRGIYLTRYTYYVFWNRLKELKNKTKQKKTNPTKPKTTKTHKTNKKFWIFSCPLKKTCFQARIFRSCGTEIHMKIELSNRIRNLWIYANRCM